MKKTVPTGRKRNTARDNTVKISTIWGFLYWKKSPEAKADNNQKVYDAYKLLLVGLEEFSEVIEE